jgi:hypothetical protein
MYPGDISGHTESNVNIRCNSVAFVPRCGVMNHGENFEIEILLLSSAWELALNQGNNHDRAMCTRIRWNVDMFVRSDVAARLRI